MSLGRTHTLFYVLSLISVFMIAHPACAAESGSGFVGDGLFQPKFEVTASPLQFAGPSWDGRQTQTLLDYEAVLGRYELSNTSHLDLDAGFQQTTNSLHASLSHGVTVKIKLAY